MFITNEIIQGLSEKFGKPKKVAFEFEVSKDEYNRIKSSQKNGREHDVTLYIIKDKKLIVIAKHFLSKSKEEHIKFTQIWYYTKEAREISRLSNNRTNVHLLRMLDYGYLTCQRDQFGKKYRFLYDADFYLELNAVSRGSIKLASIPELMRHVGNKEKAEYKAFIPNLKKIFKALDPEYEDGEY